MASLAVSLYHFQLLFKSEVAFGKKRVGMTADEVKFDLFLSFVLSVQERRDAAFSRKSQGFFI